MAIIKTIRNPVNIASLFEDPIPGSDMLYMQSDAYSKGTLAPQYDIGLIFGTSGQIGSGSTFGYSNPTADSGAGLGGVLMLNGECTHVRHRIFNTVNDYRNNIDISPFVSMDPANKPLPSKYFTDGTNNLVIASYNYSEPSQSYGYNSSFIRFWTKLNTTSKDLYNSGYLTSNISSGDTIGIFGWLVNNYAGTGGFPIYRNPTTGNLVWIANYQYTGNNSNWMYTPSSVVGASHAPAFSASPTRQAVGPQGNFSGQLVGVSKLDGYTLKLHQSVQNDHQQYFYKYNDSNNTYTTLNSYTSAPTTAGIGGTGAYNISTSTNISTATTSFTFTATNSISTFTGTATVYGTVLSVTAVTTGTLAVGMTITSISLVGALSTSTATIITSFGQGTNQGGDRSTNFGGYLPKFASKTFTDTSTSTNLAFYVPYVDNKGFYHPMYYTWNQLTDYFTRYTDITMNYSTGTSQGLYWSPDNTSASSIDVNYGLQRCWYNETFVSSGIRYLIFMQLHGAGGVWDATALQRTFVTYSVSTSSNKVLTYNSKIEVPATPKNIVWLSDDKSILGIFCHSNFYIYTFSASSGWTLTGNFPFQFNAVGRDNLGRIWAQDTGPGWGRLHLLTLNVPISIVVTSDAASYNFAGTAVTTNLTVNAFSYNGSRIATSVKLVIDGGSMTFAGSNLTKTITTSASADTLVPVTITGGGVSNIIASAVIS